MAYKLEKYEPKIIEILCTKIMSKEKLYPAIRNYNKEFKPKDIDRAICFEMFHQIMRLDRYELYDEMKADFLSITDEHIYTLMKRSFYKFYGQTPSDICNNQIERK